MAQATVARDPSGEAMLLLGSPEVVEKARAWVVTVMRMEEFLRAGTRDPQAWQVLLERQRAGREGYYTAVREDLALPARPLGALAAAGDHGYAARVPVEWLMRTVQR